jgi:putative Mn2+ efflux pump MntP
MAQVDASPSEEDIDLVGKTIDLQLISREKFAQSLAAKLTSYFGWTLLSLIGLGFVFLMVGLTIGGKDPAVGKSFVEQYLAVLQGAGTFVVSTFGSILGFILGHYFRKEGSG